MIDARLTGDFSKMFNCRVYLTSIQKLISIRDFFFPVCYSVLVTVILIYAPSDQEICDRCKVLKLCNLSWETRERSMYCIDQLIQKILWLESLEVSQQELYYIETIYTWCHIK